MRAMWRERGVKLDIARSQRFVQQTGAIGFSSLIEGGEREGDFRGQRRHETEMR